MLLIKDARQPSLQSEIKKAARTPNRPSPKTFQGRGDYGIFLLATLKKKRSGREN